MAFKIINANIIDDSRNIINAATVGVNTSSTPTAQRLWVEGAGYFSGIASASQLVSNATQGTAPISVGSSTLVSNLNVQYLNSQPGSFYQIAKIRKIIFLYYSKIIKYFISKSPPTSSRT